MIELAVHNEQGEVTGTVAVDESSLGAKVLKRLLHQVTVGYMANLRQGSASAKTKAEVQGSGAKPWRQKGTGRARAGMRRSPLWRGGGVIFPPKPRSFRQGMSRKMRRQALRSAILSKLKDRQVTVIEPVAFDAPKTRRVVSLLKALNVTGSCLIATAGHEPLLWKSARNVPHLSVLPARELNAYEVLRHRRLVVTREVMENLTRITGGAGGAGGALGTGDSGGTGETRGTGDAAGTGG